LKKKLFILQVVLKLLEEGAPFVLDSDGQTALHQAAAGGHADTVAALILGGCDASVQDFVSLFFYYYSMPTLWPLLFCAVVTPPSRTL
jgi:ankyrin repeat protein